MRKAAILGLLLVLAGCGQEPAKPAATPPASPTMAASSSAKPTRSPTPSKSAQPTAGSCADTYKKQLPRTKLIGKEPASSCFHPTGDMAMMDQGMLPRLCGKLDMPSDNLILDRIGVHEVFALGNDRGVTAMSHTVTQYAPGGATAYLTDLRDALITCGPITREGWTYNYAEVPGGEALRDESLLLKQIWHFDEQRDYALQDGSYLISVVRAGDYVSVLFDNGWESGETPAATFHDTARTAAGLI